MRLRQNSKERNNESKESVSGALWSRRFFALGALIALGLLFTSAGTKAGGCAFTYKAGAGAATPPAIPFVSPHTDGEWDEHATIVGLWHVNFTANYDENFPPGGPFPPTPFPFVESFKTWHADGTEFENAFVPPAGGNICYGVWKDLGKGTVKLHHIGLDVQNGLSLAPSSPTTKLTRSRPTEKPIKEYSISNSGLPATTPSASESQ